MTAPGVVDEPVVLTEQRDEVLVITLNRPHAKNAVNGAMARAVAEALDQLEADPSIRVGVITGAGGTFSAGMDLKGFLAGDKPLIPGRGFAGLTQHTVAKPLIAAVEGYALGGGFEVALACDLIVAAADASFGLPEVTRGLIASEGGVIRLPKRLPFHVAMEVLLTGQRLSATRAEQFGLVNRVTAGGQALPAALELADRITANAPLAIAAVKRLVRETAVLDEPAGFAAQTDAVTALRDSEDVKEGARAFAERRTPKWRGR